MRKQIIILIICTLLFSTIQDDSMRSEPPKNDIIMQQKFPPTPQLLKEDQKYPTKNQNQKITQFNDESSITIEELNQPKYQIVDVCFVLDTTGSMSGEIAQVKDIIGNIIMSIRKKVSVTNLQLRFGVVAYRDHPSQDQTYVTKILDFTNNKETISFVQELTAEGGGDFSQAVHDGLNDATKLSWREIPDKEQLRFIFHIADAPPHGSQFQQNQPQEGCLCRLSTDQVTQKINEKRIHYRLLKVRPSHSLNKMQEIFKQKIKNFNSQTIVDAEQYEYKRQRSARSKRSHRSPRSGRSVGSSISKESILELTEEMDQEEFGGLGGLQMQDSALNYKTLKDTIASYVTQEL